MPVLIPKLMMIHPHGHGEIIDPDGEVDRFDSIQCIHCGVHGRYRPGCGNKLGHCWRCAGPTCGRPECRECLGPQEARVELYERGEIAVI